MAFNQLVGSSNLARPTVTSRSYSAFPLRLVGERSWIVVTTFPYTASMTRKPPDSLSKYSARCWLDMRVQGVEIEALALLDRLAVGMQNGRKAASRLTF